MPPNCVQRSRLTTLASTILLATSLGATSASATPLTVTTFNIKFFGVNGDPDNAPGSERRIETIRQHLTREQLWTDVIVFQEIVDLEMLEKDLLGPSYDCKSYDHDTPGHQHVAICAKRKLSLVKASDEDDFAIQDVTLGKDRYRPAVHGILKDADGRDVLHVMAVHLKASPQYSDTRLQQTEVIAEYLSQRADQVPVVLLGDFNTFGDDADAMSRILSDSAEGFVEVPTPSSYTYRSGSRGQKLDHVWVSNGMAATGVKIAGPCNSNDRARINTYNRTVSDHCPVTLTLAEAENP